MNRCVKFLLPAMAGCPLAAADLGSEIATWGPLATRKSSIEYGLWFAEGFALATAGDRLNGLSTVDRAAGGDVQVAGGFAYDRSTGWDLSATYDWGRAYVRGGTDPLADEAGSPFAAVGGALCLPLWMSVQAEAGYSHDRHLLLSGEVSVFILRLRGEWDGRVETARFGTGPRILGTTAPWAWGILADWARSSVEMDGASIDAEGGIFAVFGMWRPWNHLLLGTQVQLATNALDQAEPSARSRVVAEFSFALGTVF